MNIQFRPLKAEEIEVRVDRIGEKGAVFLLYKDARCDMNILDETVGAQNWRRTHEVINGNLFCNIDIWDETKKEWVRKQDVGTESNTEKEKGQASDSFKRAGTNWGIGRELYTKIFIFIPGITKPTGKTDAKGRPVFTLINPFLKFHVMEIVTDPVQKKIKRLVLGDDKDVVAFRWEDKS